jgi:hypothetical protein
MLNYSDERSGVDPVSRTVHILRQMRDTDHPSRQEIVLPTSGGCMRPWIWPRGLLHVERCQLRELHIGDIAVWFDGRVLLSHRVVAIQGGKLVCKGDWNRQIDISPHAPQILGRAIRFSMGRISYRLDGLFATAVGRLLNRATRVQLGLRIAYHWLRPESSRRSTRP